MSGYTREAVEGLALVARFTAKTGKRDELLLLLEEAVARSADHESDGALTVTVHISPSNPDLVVAYEHYPGRASLAEHQANFQRIPAYGEMSARMSALLVKPIEIVEVATPVVRFRRQTAADPGERRTP